MVDFDNAEIISPERVLPTIKIFFVNFTKSSKLGIGTIVKLKNESLIYINHCIRVTVHLILYTYIYYTFFI